MDLIKKYEVDRMAKGKEIESRGIKEREKYKINSIVKNMLMIV